MIRKKSKERNVTRDDVQIKKEILEEQALNIDNNSSNKLRWLGVDRWLLMV